MFTSGLSSSVASLLLMGSPGVEPIHAGVPVATSDAGSRAAPVPVRQEPERTPWTWRLVPYLFAANLDGTLSVGNTEVEADVSFGDLLEKLDFGAMLLFEGHRGQLGFAIDSAYLDLGEDGKGPAGVAREADVKLGLLGVEGLYRLTPTSPYEVALGLRYLDVEQELTVGATSADGDSEILDGIVGGRATWPFAERWRFGLYGDIGAGDSDLTWQALANLGLRLRPLGREPRIPCARIRRRGRLERARLRARGLAARDRIPFLMVRRSTRRRPWRTGSQSAPG